MRKDSTVNRGAGTTERSRTTNAANEYSGVRKDAKRDTAA